MEPRDELRAPDSAASSSGRFLMRRYKHKPLARGNRQIRLLDLPFAPRTAAIVGRLRTVDFDEHHDYQAVSYTWGDVEKPCNLYIDRKFLPIGRNLHAALLQIRTRTDARYIWIDSVCIDQDNVNELTEQIAFMGEIYSRSCGTAAWLGTGFGDETNRAVFAFLSFVALFDSVGTLKREFPEADTSVQDGQPLEMFLRAFRTSRVNLRTTQSYKALKTISAIEESLMQALLAFCNSTYFSRRWIVQEIGVAQHVVVLLGAESITGYDLGNASRLLNVDGSPIREIECYNGIMLLLQNQRHSLLERMERFRQFDCRDDRDRVAALLWSSPGRYTARDFQNYRVDYARSTNDNYRDFATMLFRSKYDRGKPTSWDGQEVLCAAARRHYIRSLADVILPTWVPDWRVEPSLSPVSLGTLHHSNTATQGEQHIIEYVRPSSHETSPMQWKVLARGSHWQLQLDIEEAISCELMVTADHHNILRSGDCVLDLRYSGWESDATSKFTNWSLHPVVLRRRPLARKNARQKWTVVAGLYFRLPPAHYVDLGLMTLQGERADSVKQTTALSFDIE